MRAFGRSIVFAIGVLVLVTARPPAHAEVTLRLISGWNPPNMIVPLYEATFTKNVTEASKGEIKFQRSGPEVVPPFDQLQPVSAGVFDILFTTPGYHQAQTGVGLAFDAVKSDPDKRRESGLFSWADAYYQKRFSVRLLAVGPLPGLQFLLREPLDQDGTLKGRKIRSTPITDGIVRALGGTPVILPPTEITSAMQKGVVDGIAFTAYGAADYRLYEVSRFMTRPIFGQTDVMFAINAKRFDSLPPHLQKILLEEGRRVEKVGAEVFAAHMRKDIEIMEKNGVRVTTFTPKTAGSLNRLYGEGIRAAASKSSAAEVKAFWDLAKSKNMLNE